MAHSHSITDNKNQLAAVVGLSALVGGLTALLFTPKSGQQTRAQIRKQVADSKQKMLAKRREMLNKTSDKIDEAQQSLVETTDKAKHKVDEAADKANKPPASQDHADHIRRHGEP
jgi:gas vesicle protein